MDCGHVQRGLTVLTLCEKKQWSIADPLRLEHVDLSQLCNTDQLKFKVCYI